MMPPAALFGFNRAFIEGLSYKRRFVLQAYGDLAEDLPIGARQIPRILATTRCQFPSMILKSVKAQYLGSAAFG
jgi:hypothetical protein